MNRGLWNEYEDRLNIKHLYCKKSVFPTCTCHWTKIYPMALMSLSPLSVRYTAEFPHVFESSGVPPVPKPILESQLEQRSSLLLKIPILALNVLLQLQTALNPSLSQWYCKEACEPISNFHFSRPSDVLRYCPSAISEYRESACLSMTIKLSCCPIFIPRQIFEKGVFQ